MQPISLRFVVISTFLLHAYGAVSSSETTEGMQDGPKLPNYVILSQPRSSSSYLCRSISAHPQAECYGELLSKTVSQRIMTILSSKPRHTRTIKRKKKLINPIDVGETSAFDVVSWLLKDELCDHLNSCMFSSPGWQLPWCKHHPKCDKHRTLVKGFKVFYTHEYVDDVIDLCAKHNIPVIHLVRGSAFRRRISSLVSSQVHAPQSFDVDSLTRKARHVQVSVDMDELGSAISTHSAEVRNWSAALVNKKVRHMTVFYEVINMRRQYLPDSQVFADVFQFLGLNPEEAVLQEVPTIRYSQALSYASLISNFAQLRSAFPSDVCGLQYDSFFD